MSPIHTPWYQQNLLLVGLAALLCVAGAMATSRFFRRMTVVQDRQRYAWLFLTALASGVTIWCTHFVAMLGYHPGVAISFDWAITGLSLALPIAGSAAGFFIAGRARASRLRSASGGLVLGLVDLRDALHRHERAADAGHDGVEPAADGRLGGARGARFGRGAGGGAVEPATR